MKFIHLENNPVYVNLVGMILETGFEIHSIDVNDFAELILTLSSEKGVYGVICPYEFEGQNCLEVYNALKDDEKKAFILLDEKDPSEYPGLEDFTKSDMNISLLKPVDDSSMMSGLELLIPQLKMVEKKDIKREGIEADWSLKKERKKGEVEADWSLEKQKNSESEVNASWGIDKKRGPGGEEDASWSLEKAERKEGETEADWIARRDKGYQGKMDSDWVAKQGKGYQGEMDVDWQIKKNKQLLPENERDNKHAAIDMVKNEISKEYTAVKIKRIGTFKRSPCDVFIRLSATKFLKVINAEDDDFQQVVGKYVKKEFINLYINKSDYSSFLQSFGDQITNILDKTKKGSAKSKSAGQLIVAEIVLEQIKEVGISEKAVSLANQGVESALSLVKEGNKISGLLESVMKGKDFISEHSMMITYIAAQMGLHLGWDIKSTLEKISMAALLHDSMLSVKLAKIRSLKSPEALELSEKEREMVREHSEIIASEVGKITTMYPDVDSILVQHHERPDGSGFPRGLKALTISPISALFIIAEEFTHAVYGKTVTAELLNDIGEEFKEKYNRGNFKKPYRAFETFLTAF